MSDWRPPEPPDTHIDEVRRRVAQERIAELRVRLAEGSQPDDDDRGDHEFNQPKGEQR